MPPKRSRRASPGAQGLSAGEKLKRARLSGNDYLAWSWVGAEATSAADIAPEHRLATCGLSARNSHTYCANKYAPEAAGSDTTKSEGRKAAPVSGELEDDIIVVSDDESSACDNKTCKNNPNCLNYLGQERWENEGKARTAFLNTLSLGPDPNLDSRAEGSPVGLRNLGATCYANAFLQVWYQDLPFRSGVYNCEPSPDEETKFSESPIFQLQVTFAALQTSQQAVFNPVKLVESLRLRTTEQQDAQEFSKLFMAHLDSEFQKQADPKLKSLIADQFQGKQVYTTVCSKCSTRSERESEFLEVEVTLANNAKLEERLAQSLEIEQLDGDNKYLCSQCDSLQDAKRFTELRELPPVLHFSLLRFVYDLSTMERKKSKHAVLFPETLDMDQFVNAHSGDKKRKRSGNNKYQLRGVLLHRGSSAYHGHYEAQVYDMKDRAWYQFNDEVVTKINTLVPQAKTNGSEKSKGTSKTAKTNGKVKASGSQKSLSRNGSKEESTKIDPKDTSDDSSYISSRDAYMLIYTRVSDSPADPASSADPQPPPRALKVVEDLNAAHEMESEAYTAKEADAEERFNQTRRMVMDIYQNWSLSDGGTESAVCSKQALEAWLSRHLVKPADKKMSLVVEEEGKCYISNEDVTCEHGKLDPRKASNIKRVTRTSSARITAEDSCNFRPALTPDDVCEKCVEEIFEERIYQIEHPRLVSLFDEVSPVDEGEFGYWISKSWLKGESHWRLAKPKMHVNSKPDPPPDDPEYAHHVVCEHDGLTPNTMSRKRISPVAYDLLKEQFPHWSTLTSTAEICAVCEALIAVSREDKRGAKIQAEEEKAKLKHMHDNALAGNTNLLENEPCALVPAQFIRVWRQWLFHPANERPDSVDTSQFICEHGLLVLDPNAAGDLDINAAIIRRSDWETLETLYSCGPLIAIENTGSAWVHEPAVCEDCRRERKSSYDKTEISIRLLRAEDPTPTPETYAQLTAAVDTKPTLVTYGSRKVGGMRQSKRIRQVRELGRRRKLTITPETTVKELKVQIQTEWEIPTIAQRLFYRGTELLDGAASVRALGVLSHDSMDLKEEAEDIDLLGSGGSDAEPSAGRRRGDEGRAFGGTLLGYSSASSPPQSPPPSAPQDATPSLSCPACTFDNVPDAFACAMCETALA